MVCSHCPGATRHLLRQYKIPLGLPRHCVMLVTL